MTPEEEALHAIVDQQKAKLLDRANQVSVLEHDLRNSRLAVTGYRELSHEHEAEVVRLRKELEDALRECALLKDDLRRALAGYRDHSVCRTLSRSAADLFAPPAAQREEDIPPYTQTK